MTIVPQSEIFEAARKAHFAVTLHKPADFEGMRRAGRLAAEVLDLLVPHGEARRHHRRAGQGGL